MLQNQIAVPHAAKQLVLLSTARFIFAKAWFVPRKAWLIDSVERLFSVGKDSGHQPLGVKSGSHDVRHGVRCSG